MPGGFFITFEGLDGSGKTTQVDRLYRHLTERGLPVVRTRQPGGTPFGDRIRALLLDSRVGGIDPAAELAMMFADRVQVIQEVIRPALARDGVVLCDRFTDSTEAYQGGGRELGSERILTLHRELCDGLKPDLTLLLMPSLERSLERARRRNRRHLQIVGTDENRFEREDDAFYRRVYQAYEAIAEREPSRVVCIRSDASVGDIEAEILQIVLSKVADRVTVAV